MSSGLLQLSVVRGDRQTYAACTVGAECCGKADHRSQTSRTHHTDIASAAADDELNSRWPAWYTKCCQAKYLPMADNIHLASDSSARSLRYSSKRKCSVTRVHSRFGDRCFAAAGQRIWNNLPASLRDKEVTTAQNSENN